MIRKVVYRLKREFGLPITIVQQTNETADLTTGDKSVTKVAVPVARAILLPRKAQGSFKYDIGYLKANSNFTYGGFFNDATREVIIDRKDLKGFVISANENFSVYHNHKRYQVKSVSDFDGIAYFLVLEQMEDAPIDEVHVVSVGDDLTFSEDVTNGP